MKKRHRRQLLLFLMAAFAITVSFATGFAHAASRPDRAAFSRLVDILRSKNPRQIEQAVNDMGRYENLRYAPLYSALAEAIPIMDALPDSHEYRYLELDGWLSPAATKANIPDLFERGKYDAIAGLGDSAVLCWLHERAAGLTDTGARSGARRACARLLSDLGGSFPRLMPRSGDVSRFLINKEHPEYASIASAAHRYALPRFDEYSFRKVLLYRDIAVVHVADAPEGGRATAGYELFLFRENGTWTLLGTGLNWIS